MRINGLFWARVASNLHAAKGVLAIEWPRRHLLVKAHNTLTASHPVLSESLPYLGAHTLKVVPPMQKEHEVNIRLDHLTLE